MGCLLEDEVAVQEPTAGVASSIFSAIDSFSSNWRLLPFRFKSNALLR